ncbi:hypothetical protein V2J09_001460 [Rumex salicifolius]
MSFAFYDQNIFLYNEIATELEHSENSLVECSVANGDIIPPASVLRQLSLAVELWLEDEYVPGIPKDVINCCISRKKRHEIYTELLESLENEVGCHEDVSDVPKVNNPLNSGSYARLITGEFALRLGAHRPADNLSMLETGELVYTPLTQEGPLLTEDLIQEHEEFVLRTGRRLLTFLLPVCTLSLGPGCSQLLSDMQAFKAANPGCILEDFVRWHSPPDWTEASSSDEADEVLKEEIPRGRLSSRMQKEGNLWLELWETSKPVPSVRQAPLFDEDLAVEGILTAIEEIRPSHLFGQLFLTLLGVGFVLAEAILPIDNEEVSRLFFECKDYVVAICEGHCWTQKIGDLCQNNYTSRYNNECGVEKGFCCSSEINQSNLFSSGDNIKNRVSVILTSKASSLCPFIMYWGLIYVMSTFSRRRRRRVEGTGGDEHGE